MLTRTHAAFLRAINTGDRRLTMDELRAAFAPLDLTAVATWQETGNVAFAATGDVDIALLERRIAAVLEEGLGIPVPAIVRTTDQVLAIATDVPFTTEQLAATAGHVQVLFVRDAPRPAVIARVLGHADADDELSWGRRELWWLPRAEVAESRLPIAALERELGPATLRSHRSVAGLAARHLVT